MELNRTTSRFTFLSTLSLRRATPPRMIREPATTGFLSTLSLRRATYHEKTAADCFSISIHALLAESDALPGWWTAGPAISIHALLAESDLPAGILRR